jgi:hypothetical protein
MQLNLNMSAEEMKEQISQVPPEARKELNEMLHEVIEKMRAVKALNTLYAIQDHIEGHDNGVPDDCDGDCNNCDIEEIPEGVTIQ